MFKGRLTGQFYFRGLTKFKITRENRRIVARPKGHNVKIECFGCKFKDFLEILKGISPFEGQRVFQTENGLNICRINPIEKGADPYGIINRYLKLGGDGFELCEKK